MPSRFEHTSSKAIEVDVCCNSKARIFHVDYKGSFTIVKIYVLVQRVLGGRGSEAASVLFLKC